MKLEQFDTGNILLLYNCWCKVIRCSCLITSTVKHVPIDIIIGPLSSVKNLILNNSRLVWDPPFSLNLTNIAPNIVYCVNIYNNSCSRRHHVISDCNLLETTYSFHTSQEMDLLEYVVIPRSNVANARNGTPSFIRGTKIQLYSDITISTSLHIYRGIYLL